MAKIIDANIVLRFLLGDSPTKTAAIKKLLGNKEEKLILTDVTIAEIIWTLSAHYQKPKGYICEKVFYLLELPGVTFSRPLILNAILLYQNHNIDYIDAYIAAYAQENKISEIVSYDRHLDKIKEIQRIEP